MVQKSNLRLFHKGTHSTKLGLLLHRACALPPIFLDHLPLASYSPLLCVFTYSSNLHSVNSGRTGAVLFPKAQEVYLLHNSQYLLNKYLSYES